MNYKVEAWSWCADYCKKNQWNPHDSYFWNKANLEYRRQHNIFEVGDKVKAKDHQFGFDELFRIDDFFADDDGVNLAVLDDGDCYPISFLEHATDAEIKAGKRLEVNDGN